MEAHFQISKLKDKIGKAQKYFVIGGQETTKIPN